MSAESPWTPYITPRDAREVDRPLTRRLAVLGRRDRVINCIESPQQIDLIRKKRERDQAGLHATRYEWPSGSYVTDKQETSDVIKETMSRLEATENTTM